MAHLRQYVGPGPEKNVSHSITGGEFIGAGRKTSGHHNTSNLNANYYLSSGNLTWASEFKVDALGHPISMVYAVNPRRGTLSKDPVLQPPPDPSISNPRLFDRHFYETAYSASHSPGFSRGQLETILNEQRPLSVPSRTPAQQLPIASPAPSRSASASYQPKLAPSVFRSNPWRRFTTTKSLAPAYSSTQEQFRRTASATKFPQPDKMASTRPNLDKARLFDNSDSSGHLYASTAGMPSFHSRPTGKLFMEDADTGLALGVRDSRINPITSSVKPTFGPKPLNHHFRDFLSSTYSEEGIPGYTGHRPRMRFMCGTRTD